MSSFENPYRVSQKLSKKVDNVLFLGISLGILLENSHEIYPEISISHSLFGIPPVGSPGVLLDIPTENPLENNF